ncbi:MAG: S1 RNA-binding domain-containing protein [Planctomycetaceae bacterium]|nr:S1 RNA-binding domain-containing protein [Planctomycetaceae bacterium]
MSLEEQATSDLTPDNQNVENLQGADIVSPATAEAAPQPTPVREEPEATATPPLEPAAETGETPAEAGIPQVAMAAELEAPTAELPVAETVEAACAETPGIQVEQPVSPGESVPEAAPARKIQLNPTRASTEAKAVPSIPQPEQPEPRGVDVAQSAPSAEAVPSRGPVEIPKLDQLDDELESQLNAAMQASQLAPAAASADSQAPTPGMPLDETELEPGTKLKGTVESIDEENILVDIGYRASGVLSRRHFAEGKLPEIGSKLEVVVETIKPAEGIVQLGLLRSAHRASSDWDTLVVGQTIECSVQKTNKGGLEVQVGQLRGFMPAGQVDLYFIGDLEPFVGQKLLARVTDVNPKKRNLVLSRRALLQEERDASEAEAWERLAVGDQCTGTVKTLKDYGAFIDIGGVDGLLHVRELSWTRVNHPSDVLQAGQQVDVKILSLDREKKKISLGMKQLVTNPWDYAEQKYPKNTVVRGLVKKVTEFGAFVEIEPGLEGLVHISELDYRRVNHVQEVLKEGQEAEAQVLEINKNKRRISLSVKALKQKPGPSPEELAAEQASAAEDQLRREADLKRRQTLKGGTGTGKGGGLFGNPADY